MVTWECFWVRYAPLNVIKHTKKNMWTRIAGVVITCALWIYVLTLIQFNNDKEIFNFNSFMIQECNIYNNICPIFYHKQLIFIVACVQFNLRDNNRNRAFKIKLPCKIFSEKYSRIYILCSHLIEKLFPNCHEKNIFIEEWRNDTGIWIYITMWWRKEENYLKLMLQFGLYNNIRMLSIYLLE